MRNLDYSVQLNTIELKKVDDQDKTKMLTYRKITIGSRVNKIKITFHNNNPTNKPSFRTRFQWSESTYRRQVAKQEKETPQGQPVVNSESFL